MTLPVDQIIQGHVLDVLKTFPPDSIDCVITSPPYWGLRSYGPDTITVWDGGAWKGQLGLEPDAADFIRHIVQIFQDIKRVLKPGGSCWLDLGDSYYGSNRGSHDYRQKDGLGNDPKERYGHERDNSKRSNWLQPKQKMLIPERVAIGMQDQGWILRNMVVWHKVNHMPSSVRDRLATAYESVFFFVKKQRYYFDLDAIRIPSARADYKDYRGRIKPSSRTLNKHEGIRSGHGPKLGKPNNPLSANPADVWGYEGKFKGSENAETFGSPRARTQRQKVNWKTLDKNEKGQPRASTLWKSSEAPRTDHPLGGNPSDVWSLTTEPFKDAHFAVFPQKLVHRILLAACPRQICPTCGKARRRITDTNYLIDRA